MAQKGFESSVKCKKVTKITNKYWLTEIMHKTLLCILVQQIFILVYGEHDWLGTVSWTVNGGLVLV